MEGFKTSTASVTEANDVLNNGILIETSKGVEWLSLTDALTSGVGGLNLSVEDFQNVATQLLSSQMSTNLEEGMLETNTFQILKSQNDVQTLCGPAAEFPKQLVNSGDQHCESADELPVYEELTEHISDSYCSPAQPDTSSSSCVTTSGSLVPKTAEKVNLSAATTAFIPHVKLLVRTVNVKENRASESSQNSTSTSEVVPHLSLTENVLVQCQQSPTIVGGISLTVEELQNAIAHLLTAQNPASDIEGGGVIEVFPTEVSLNDKKDSCSVIVPQCVEMLDKGVENSDDGDQETTESEKIVYTTKKGISAKKSAIVSTSFSSTTGMSESTNSDSSIQSVSPCQVKRKGGWPKGRKRKPELEHRAPKAPATGYVLYLNEKRKLLEYKDMAFTEVTKILGNEWSKLSLPQKRLYLDLAEKDKKRYREELRIYRKSDAYRLYLRRKRMKSLLANGTEESDIDGTDEIDEEDNEELYCRACDQWFVSLHNKKEHLYGRQHFQVISQQDHNRKNQLEGSSSLSVDESSLDGVSNFQSLTNNLNDLPSVNDAVANFIHLITEREKEIVILRQQLQKSIAKQKSIMQELTELKRTETRLLKELAKEHEETNKLELSVHKLWSLISVFVSDEGEAQ